MKKAKKTKQTSRRYKNIKELVIDDKISDEIIKRFEEIQKYQIKTRNVSVGEY